MPLWKWYYIVAHTIEEQARDTVNETTLRQGEDNLNSANRLIRVTEHYVRMDYEEKDDARLYRVTIGGEAPLTTQIQEMKSGVQQAWAAISLPILGFGLIDALARHFNGDPIQPVLDQKFPWQIVTTENVKSVVLDGADSYVGLADYDDAFSALWHAGTG